MKYYKFKSQEDAEFYAERCKTPIYTHENWLFAFPENTIVSIVAIGKDVIINIDDDLEHINDISSYPQYIIVKYEEEYINLPIKESVTKIKYNPYNTPYYRDLEGYNTLIREFELTDIEKGNWSSPRTKTVSFGEQYLKEQIRARYGFFERPTNGKSNVVIDSYFPGLLYMNDMKINNIRENVRLPATAVAISPFVANIMNVKQIPTEQLIRVLGYTIKDIKKLLLMVKKKNINFVFAGAGGTGMNTAYYLDQLCKITNTINLFHKVYIYEKDKIETSNLLRFPVDVRALNINTNTANKRNLIKPFADRLSKTQVESHPQYITAHSKPWNIYDHRVQGDNIKSRIKPNTIVYGAPAIEDRDAISQSGGFICATHAATTASIWLNPKQDESIQVESYGLIQLGGFFMNQLKMAITLLEILADDDLDLHEQDKELLDYEFDGTIQLPTDRQYTWQLDSNLHMFTDDQLNTI